MNNKNIKISVIIPVYNCEKTIKRCLYSVINQTYKNYQIIIVNDGSEDNTDLIIKELIDQNPKENIIYISTENFGVSHARNIALAYIKGDVVTFLDSDDYYDNNYFKSINNNFSDVDILLYGYRTIFNDKTSNIHYGKNLTGRRDFLFRELSSKKLFNPVCNKVYSRNIIENIIFNEELNLGEDFLFFTQCLYKTDKIKYIDEIYYNYDIDLNGLGFRKRKNMFNSKVVGMSWMLKLYIDNNFCLTDISGIYVKNLISDYIALLNDKELSKKNIKELKNNAIKQFDFKKLEYNIPTKILLNIYLSDSFYIIKLCTMILNKIDMFLKRKNFKIKR